MSTRIFCDYSVQQLLYSDKYFPMLASDNHKFSQQFGKPFEMLLITHRDMRRERAKVLASIESVFGFYAKKGKVMEKSNCAE